MAVDLLEESDLLGVVEAVAAAEHGVHKGEIGAVEPGVRLRARLPRLGLVLVGEEGSELEKTTHLLYVQWVLGMNLIFVRGLVAQYTGNFGWSVKYYPIMVLRFIFGKSITLRHLKPHSRHNLQNGISSFPTL